MEQDQVNDNKEFNENMQELEQVEQSIQNVNAVKKLMMSTGMSASNAAFSNNDKNRNKSIMVSDDNAK